MHPACGLNWCGLVRKCLTRALGKCTEAPNLQGWVGLLSADSAALQWTAAARTKHLMLARVAVGEGGYSSVLRLSWLFTTLDLEIIPQHVSATTLNIVFILPWFQLQFWGFCLTKHRGNKPHYAGHVGQRLGLNYHQYRPCPCAPARPLHGAATLTERGANGGLRNIVSWRVENLGGDGGPAFHCLYFTAMQSTQNSSGTSRKGFFCSGIGLFSLVFLSLVGFFPHVEEEASTVMVTRARNPALPVP